MMTPNATNELELIYSAKNGDNEAMKKIIDMHSGICISIYSKYVNKSIAPKWIIDDVSSSKDYIIFNSVSSFDETKGSKFSTWLANQTKFYCLNKINKFKKMPKIQDVAEDQNYENFITEELLDFNAEKNKANAIESIRDLLSSISDNKIKQVIEKKYLRRADNKTASFTEIAKEMNVSVQTVINWHNKFIDTARKKVHASKRTK